MYQSCLLVLFLPFAFFILPPTFELDFGVSSSPVAFEIPLPTALAPFFTAVFVALATFEKLFTVFVATWVPFTPTSTPNLANPYPPTNTPAIVIPALTAEFIP